MVWPSVLTTDSDIKNIAWVQGLDRMLESGNDYSGLHQSVAIEIRNWLESRGGIPDADKITNTDVFKNAAAFLFVNKVLGSNPRYEKQANAKYAQYKDAMKIASPKLSEQPETGGIVAQIVVTQPSNLNYTSIDASNPFRQI